MAGKKTVDELEFWEKVRASLKVAGKNLIEPVLQLYYVASQSETPLKVRAAVWGALAYFVLPFDVVPDALPVVGYGDDLALVLNTLAMAQPYLTGEIKERAKQKINEWFGS